MEMEMLVQHRLRCINAGPKEDAETENEANQIDKSNDCQSPEDFDLGNFRIAFNESIKKNRLYRTHSAVDD